MTKEEQIDFIKWLYKKAGKPFQICEYPAITSIYIPSKEHSIDILNFKSYCPDYIWSFLLQKAIEGINFESGGPHNYRIEQLYSQIDVCDVEEYDVEIMFDYNKYETIDKAKESALIWVKENES
jgi:hypothetical protein